MNIIVIPIYKSTLNDDEITSLKQCFKILGTHKISFITPKSLDIQYYQNLCDTLGVSCVFETFEDLYFKGLKGYNKLLMSAKFYQRFKAYNFMLIYQLDAWVFRDELDYWCEQNYDYIGAPWFYKGQGNTSFYGVGNGGFSLRKISSFIKITTGFYRTRSLSYLKSVLLSRPYNFKGKVGVYFQLIKAFFYFKNNTHYKFNDFPGYEDKFWGFKLSRTISWYKVPEPIEASKFSFELNPEFLYKLNKNKLPFGCHGWEKYEPEFWNKYIK
ncbi:DUF5672 family protein [Formosa undariae]|uniref:DUF5672 family protein n=1 Tax=Formosa undariae TaxID=1325436 RepID=A0ABV5F594_9FLAO